MDSPPDPDAELRARVRQQQAVAELGQQALRTDDVEQLFRDAADVVVDTLDADHGAVFEHLSGDAELLLREGVGWREGAVGTATVPADADSWIANALDTGGPVVVENRQTDERVSTPPLLDDHGVVSGVTAVLGSVEEPWGVLSVHATERREFTDCDALFVQSVADVLASATEREAARRQLDEVYSRITDAFFGLDDDWTFTHVNERAEELLVSEGGELEGENVWEAFPEATDSQFEEEYRTAMETQESATFEAYYPPLDAWYEVNAYPSETGLSVYFRDVTDRKEHEHELELFRTLLDHSTDSVLVIDSDTGEYLDVNDTACRRRGYSRDELLDLSVTDLELEIPDQATWQSFVEDLREAEELTFDGRHRRKDGSTYPVEVNATYVELDREYVLAVARDVTERRERELELEQYRALTQAANDAIVTIDEDSVVQSVNPAVEEIFGYEPEELVGEPLTVLMSPEMSDRHYTALGRYLGTGERTLDWNYVEVPGRHRDGTDVPLAISFSESKHAGERYFTGIVRDVTEHKEYERQLEASNERLEQFAYAASHDLQEPLRMVSSYLQLVERRYAEELDADGREFIEYAVDGADRMRNMIEGLLEYSRIETQGDPFESVDLDAVLADVLDDLQVRTEETDAEITHESLPTVAGDASQLRQVFQNLLKNAITYSGDEPPRVDITADREGDEWLISVRDEGIGIDAEDADRVFEVFQRLHSQEEHAGTGIGLPLCRRIVERHGGDIWVDSVPGVESTFSFTLPADAGT